VQCGHLVGGGFTYAPSERVSLAASVRYGMTVRQLLNQPAGQPVQQVPNYWWLTSSVQATLTF
jgi:hypothetical protein